MHFKKKREKKEAKERQKYIDWQMQRKRDRFINKTEECKQSLFCPSIRFVCNLSYKKRIENPAYPISASSDLYEALIETIPIYNTTKYSEVVVENKELYLVNGKL